MELILFDILNCANIMVFLQKLSYDQHETSILLLYSFLFALVF